MDIPLLQQKLAHELSTNNLQVIYKLKFQNLIYQSGDNIQLRTDINSPNALYAKILSIVQAKNVTNFPLVYVMWYQIVDTSEGMQSSANNIRKELMLTENKDWQYIQAVRGKINVINEIEFLHLDPKQQENPNLFYCRSYLSKNMIQTTSKPQCYCLNYHAMEKPLVRCQLCGVLMHLGCCGSKEGRCGRCSIEK